MKNIEHILKLIKTVSPNDHIYVVGGWLRDKLAGRANRDLDVVTLKNPMPAAKKFSTAAGGSFVVLDARNCVYRVVINNIPELEYVDFAKMKAPGIEEDLLKRDFTVNSMAAEILPGGKLGDILDPASGRKDLAKGVIRMTSRKSFSDDPLRILRAFRIAAELGLKIEGGTLKSTSLASRSILKSASERVRDELVKTFSTAKSSEWLFLLEKQGILENIIPEIIPMKRSAKNFYFHPKGLWQHSQETLSSLEEILSKLKKYFPHSHEQLEAHMSEPLSAGMNRQTLLKFIAILHDCAKPECAKKFGKKMRFLGHEQKGARMIEKILKRLRMSSKEVSIAKNLTANHMRPVSLSQTGLITQRASFRLFRDIGENTPDLLLLSLADWHSYKRIKTHSPADLKKQESVLKELVLRYFEHRSKQGSPRLIDGNILMKKLRIEPGPLVGALLKFVAEAQALGKISSEKEALKLSSQKLTLLAKKYKIKL